MNNDDSHGKKGEVATLAYTKGAAALNHVLVEDFRGISVGWICGENKGCCVISISSAFEFVLCIQIRCNDQCRISCLFGCLIGFQSYRRPIGRVFKELREFVSVMNKVAELNWVTL